MTNLLLIDDHPAVRHGLGLVLMGQAHAICGEAGSLAEARQLIAASSADIALLDLSLGEENGADLVTALRERTVATLVYSMHDDAQTISATFDTVVDAYVSKREPVEALFAAIDDVLQGRKHLSPLVARNLARGNLQTPCALQDSALNERESAIVAILGRGETNGEIAGQLESSVRTLETYFERICNKLCVGGTRELRRHAIHCASRRL